MHSACRLPKTCPRGQDAQGGETVVLLITEASIMAASEAIGPGFSAQRSRHPG